MPAQVIPAAARPYVRDCGRAGKSVGWILVVATAFLFALLYREGGGPLAVLLALAAVGGIGAGLALWQRGVRLEDNGAKVTAWSGPGLALFRESWPRTAVTGVRVDKKVAVTSKGTFVHYLVRITRQGGLGDLSRRSFREGHLARREAEAIAKVLHADLRDETVTPPAVREAAYLDEPLVAHLRRVGIAAPPPAPPARMTAGVRQGEGGTYVIEIPPFGFRAQLLAPLVMIPAMFGALLVSIGFAESGGGGGVSWGRLGIGLLLIAGLPTLMLFINLLTAITRRETIEVSRAGIAVCVRSLIGSDLQRVAMAEIEEVTAPDPLPGVDDAKVGMLQVFGVAHPATQVLVRTDRGDTLLGRALPLAERRWLRDLLVHALAASADASSVAAASATAAVPSGGDSGPAIRRYARHTAIAVVVAGIAIALLEVSGARHRLVLPGGTVAEPAVDYARYELKPGPGSSILRIYGRGALASTQGPDVHLSVEEVLLLSTHRRASTTFRELSVSIHRKAEGQWRLVGHAEMKLAGAAIAPAGAVKVPGPHAFLVRGAAEACRQGGCLFRLHILGQAGSDRPGWDVTDMAPLALRP